MSKYQILAKHNIHIPKRRQRDERGVIKETITRWGKEKETREEGEKTNKPDSAQKFRESVHAQSEEDFA